MIEVLGLKRIATMAILFCLICVSSAAYFLLILPQQEKSSRELSRVKNNISASRANIEKLQTDFATLEQVKSRYTQIQDFGFFSDQNRVIARSKINQMKKESGVLSARYNISALEFEDHNALSNIDYQLARSTIRFNIEAYDDVDVYRFIYLLNYGFPGVVKINRISIERIRDVSAPLLRNIGTGSNTPLVDAQIFVDWYTVLPISKDELDGR